MKKISDSVLKTSHSAAIIKVLGSFPVISSLIIAEVVLHVTL